MKTKVGRLENKPKMMKSRIGNWVEHSIDFLMTFYMFWGPFGEAFGGILGSKSRSNFRVIFGMRFCSLGRRWRGFGAATTRAWRGSRGGGCPQGGALFARGGIL